MKQLIKWTRRLLFPAWPVLILLAAVSAAALVHVFSHGYNDHWGAYAAYALSAYTLIACCCRAPSLFRKCRRSIRSIPFARRMWDDLLFRQIVLLYLTLALNLFFAAFHFATGLLFHTSWLHAAAFYYLILSIVRFQLSRDFRRGMPDDSEAAFKRYRSCGILLCLLTAVVLFMVFDLLRDGHGTVYPGSMVYAVAFYAFFSLISSCISMIRFRRQHNALLSAAKAFSLATALVSMFSLQATLLTTFDDNALPHNRYNFLTGMAVCLLILSIALFMIWHSTRMLRQRTNHPKEDTQYGRE